MVGVRCGPGPIRLDDLRNSQIDTLKEISAFNRFFFGCGAPGDSAA
jgi:hypothetical protein